MKTGSKYYGFKNWNEKRVKFFREKEPENLGMKTWTQKNELGNSTKCPENSHSCVYSSCTEAGGTNFIIRNCGDVTKIEKEDICRLGVI